MFILFIFIYTSLSLTANYPTFPAPYDNTPIATDNPTDINKMKCSTCCKVLFVSNYNIDFNKPFTDQDDINQITRYAFNMEFEQINDIRKPKGEYEQTVLLRPLNFNQELSYFELYPYKMINSFVIPKRVLDIKGGSKAGSNLIIWEKKNPLLPTTDNQRFVYNYPYSFSREILKYPKHFYLPFSTSIDLCFEILTDKFNVWNGNINNLYSTDVYQIIANKCDNNNMKQSFEVVFG